MLSAAFPHVSPQHFEPLVVSGYQRDGFAVVRSLVDLETVRLLRDSAAEIAAAGAHLTHNATIKGVIYCVQSATGRSGEAAIASGIFRKMMFARKASPVLKTFAKDERLLGPVREAGCTKPRCVLDQINLKAANVGTGFPWHHDAHFVSKADQEAIAKFGGVNAVLALDAAGAENGGFEVLAGSHLLGPRKFDYDTGGNNDADFDLTRRELLTLEPGDAVFFHPYLIHGSGVNRSGAPRCLLTYWFIQQPS